MNEQQPYDEVTRALLGNPEAMRRGERFVEQDINRLFDGRHEQSSGFEALRANELERFAAAFFSKEGRARLHYDLHTAIRGSKIEQFALYPWQEGRAHSRQELQRLRAAGIEAVLLQNKASTTFSAYTYAQLGAEAFTLELGKARAFGQNELVNLDLLVARNFQVTERFRAELRGEFYNATNRLHLGRPNVQTNAGQAGRITNTQVPNRQVQLGLRLVF